MLPKPQCHLRLVAECLVTLYLQVASEELLLLMTFEMKISSVKYFYALNFISPSDQVAIAITCRTYVRPSVCLWTIFSFWWKEGIYQQEDDRNCTVHCQLRELLRPAQPGGRGTSDIESAKWYYNKSAPLGGLNVRSTAATWLRWSQ